MRSRGHLVDVIDEGRASGEFRSDIPTSLLRDMVFGAIEHHSWPYVARAVAAAAGGTDERGALDIDTAAEQITSVLCDGIGRSSDEQDGMRRLSELAARLEKATQK